LWWAGGGRRLNVANGNAHIPAMLGRVSAGPVVHATENCHGVLQANGTDVSEAQSIFETTEF